MPTPTLHTILSDIATPAGLFHRVCGDEPTAFLLESTEGTNRLARYSFVGFAPVQTVAFKKGRAVVQHFAPLPVAILKPEQAFPPDKTGLSEILQVDNPLHYLKSVTDQLDTTALRELSETLEIPFLGGWVGYMGYGATQYFDGIPQQEEHPTQAPDGYYGLYDTVLLFDHLHRTITFLSLREPAQAEQLWQTVQERLSTAAPLPPLSYQPEDVPEESLFQRIHMPWSQMEYCQGVQQAKQWIQEGEVFQIVLAHRFSLPTRSDAMTIYRMIQSVNPSPYAYLLKFPELSYVGSSPETFMSCLKGTVTLRALAGTRHRGATAEEDEALGVALKANEKEMAEHRMLVDLARNDLGRVCEVGSIQVGEVATITRYTHVMHLATEVSGQLRAGLSCYEVFQSCFPRGTVSGAPKIRAMNLLSTLEPEHRGVYSGVVGYFDFLGNTDGAIAIRSALVQENPPPSRHQDGAASNTMPKGLDLTNTRWVHVHAGAGVVYDSDPLAEYHETLNKARSILKAVVMADQQASVRPPLPVS